MNSRMMRAFIVGVAAASVFFIPAWIPLVGMSVLALRYPLWEAVAVAFLVDLLYAPHAAFFGIPFPATILMVIVVWVLRPWRAQLAVGA